MFSVSLPPLLLLSLCFCVVPSLSLVSRIKLSPNGPEVSRIVYGSLHLGEAPNAAAALALIENALSLGITTFDLSDVYGGAEKNMKLFGQAINLKPGLRPKMEIIAKMDVLNGYDTSKEHLELVMADYLSFLQTNYIDLVLLHRQDYLMDVAEVAQVFLGWKAAGKVLYFGTSNHDAYSYLALNDRVPLVTNEVEVSVWSPNAMVPLGVPPISPDTYFTNNGLVEFHYQLNQSVLAWGPLGGNPYGGLNRLFKVNGARQTQVLKALQASSMELKDEVDVIALAWLLRHPANIVPILGTMNLERMTNQTRSEAIAKIMTRKQWYDIARSIGVPLP